MSLASVRIAELTPLNVGAAALTKFGVLSLLTLPARAGEIAELQADGVGAARIARLYPFDLAEHLPQIAARLAQQPQLAAHLSGAQAQAVFERYKQAGTPEAEALSSATDIVTSHFAATQRASGATVQVRSAAVYHWAYLLTFFHALGSQTPRLVIAQSSAGAHHREMHALADKLISLSKR